MHKKQCQLMPTNVLHLVPRWYREITNAPYTEQLKNLIIDLIDKNGGAKGSRTPDLLNAIQALYQLSYGPILWAWSNPKLSTSLPTPPGW
jgi:hypothetical protein